MALYDHLRSQPEYPPLHLQMPTESFHARPSGRVVSSIHPKYPCLRKLLFYQFLNLLCPCAEILRYKGNRRTDRPLSAYPRSRSNDTPACRSVCVRTETHHNGDILLHIRRTCKKQNPAYPLRFRNSMICSFFSRRSSISSCKPSAQNRTVSLFASLPADPRRTTLWACCCFSDRFCQVQQTVLCPALHR